MTLLQIDEVITPDAALAVQDFILKFGTRFLINVVSVFVLIRFIYFKMNKSRIF